MSLRIMQDLPDIQLSDSVWVDQPLRGLVDSVDEYAVLLGNELQKYQPQSKNMLAMSGTDTIISFNVNISRLVLLQPEKCW